MHPSRLAAFALVGVVDAPQSCKTRSGNSTRRVEMEQLPDVCLRRRGLGKGQLSGVAGEDNVFRLAVPLIRNPRMSGAPGAAWRPKFENRYSMLILGSFGHYRLVSLALVGTHFIRKREILLARLFRKSSFSPPAEESCQHANDDYRHGKRNEEP